MAALFNSSDSEEEVNLKTENEYAKRYDNWREKEELHKLEQKYGENPVLSSSDSEDDSEPEFSEMVEQDFLKTLALLKKKDPRIYDKNFKFFKEEEKRLNTAEAKEESPPKHVKKKEVKSLSQMFEQSDSSEDDEEILKAADKSQTNNVKTDKLKEFLTGKVEHLGDEVEKDLEPLKKIWADPNIDEKEKFLRDFVLEKKYLEDLDADDETVRDKLRDDENLEEDEKTIEAQKNFERAYNFRFEEPDAEYIKRYPRTMSSIRPKDDRRSRKRAEVRARKEEEKNRKMEEIARLKALKLKEIQEKIAKIKEVTGNEELAFREEDIEGDFDPEEHDRRMKALFDSQYYQEADEEKPEFPDLDEELEIENWEKIEQEQLANADGPHCEDDDFNMDADYDPKKARATSLMDEIKETLGKKRRNRKRKSKLAEILATEKPKFDPTKAEKSYNEFMEEYYKLDCEDVIGGDLPTRFKYRDVVANDFGLNIEEILLADDKELNKWVSLKKAVKYRPDFVEKSEVNTYRLKSTDVELKKKLLPSLFNEDDLDELTTQEAPQKKKKKKEDLPPPPEEKKVKKRKMSEDKVTIETNNPETVEPTKKKRRRKKNKKNNGIVDNNQSGDAEIVSLESKKEKKKKISTEKTEMKKDREVENGLEKKHTKKDKKNKQGPVVNGKNNNKFKKKKNKVEKTNVDGDSAYLNSLSDERLKAFGLNPKKYRNFLKFKKR